MLRGALADGRGIEVEKSGQRAPGDRFRVHAGLVSQPGVRASRLRGPAGGLGPGAPGRQGMEPLQSCGQLLAQLGGGLLGEGDRRQVRDDYWSGDKLVIIEGVPVGMCDRCGERYYSAAVLEKMDRIAGRRSKFKRTIKVPVTSFETSA